METMLKIEGVQIDEEALENTANCIKELLDASFEHRSEAVTLEALKTFQTMINNINAQRINVSNCIFTCTTDGEKTECESQQLKNTSEDESNS